MSDQLKSPASRRRYATRRFGIGTLAVAMAIYGVLLTSLRLGVAPVEVMFFASVFLPIVGAGQALLFGGKRPRTASLLIGAVCSVAPTSVAVYAYGNVPPLWEFLVTATIVGAFLGYAAGELVGWVFLISDEFDMAAKRLRKR